MNWLDSSIGLWSSGSGFERMGKSWYLLFFCYSAHCSLRKLEAAQHFAGNESFSQYDLIEKMTESLLEVLQEEGTKRTVQLQGAKEEE